MYRFIPHVDLAGCEFLNFRAAVLSEPCPHCQRTGAIRAHGFIRSSSDSDAQDRTRALRFFCSDRRNHAGCGRTFSIHWSHVVPRSTISAELVSDLIASLIPLPERHPLTEACTAGISTVSKSTAYRWAKRFRLHLGELRSRASMVIPPDRQAHATPETATLAQLQQAFPGEACLVAAFQSQFQKAFCRIDTNKVPISHRVVQTFRNLFRVATRDGKSTSHLGPRFNASEATSCFYSPPCGTTDPNNPATLMPPGELPASP